MLRNRLPRLFSRLLSQDVRIENGLKKERNVPIWKLNEIGKKIPLEELIRLRGWVKVKKKMGKHFYILKLSDGTTIEPLQLIMRNLTEKDRRILKEIQYANVIECCGLLRLIVDKRHSRIQLYELDVLNNSMNILSISDQYPYRYKTDKTKNMEINKIVGKNSMMDLLRNEEHIRIKESSILQSVMRIRSSLYSTINNLFEEKNRSFVTTPTFTLNNCEGGSDSFALANKQFFSNQNIFLTVSSQLHLECLANSLGDCYTVGRVFRSEKSLTRKHLAEFDMLEMEFQNIDSLPDLMEKIEEDLKDIIRRVMLKKEKDLINALSNSSGSTTEKIKNLKNLLNEPFIRLSYEESINILREKCKLSISVGDDIGGKEEKELFKYLPSNISGIFIYRWRKEMKSFYMKSSEGNGEFVENVDLILKNGGEVVGGSLRETNYEQLLMNLNIEKMKEKELKKLSIYWYLQLRRCGLTNVGGYGMGIDRLLLILTGMTTIRDVVPFPRFYNNCKN
ncbi:hypothetical protein SNEBB_003068 [Seison nebaliae]|nr:hypothetical protein SNEBB_003068 [Seison nebaliae]